LLLLLLLLKHQNNLAWTKSVRVFTESIEVGHNPKKDYPLALFNPFHAGELANEIHCTFRFLQRTVFSTTKKQKQKTKKEF